MTKEDLKLANSLKDKIDSIDDFLSLSKSKYSVLKIEVNGAESQMGRDITREITIDWHSIIGQQLVGKIMQHKDSLEEQLNNI